MVATQTFLKTLTNAAPAEATVSAPDADQSEPLSSVHTNTFAQLLHQIGASLVVSTYQAGRLIVIRPDGDVINTHFRVFDKPMGLAADAEKIALGTASHIWELRLDFWGDFAFIGLSQVRESAVFSGIPLTQTLTERICGVWVVNIITGEIVAFLRFEAGVQEIFSVSILPGLRFPEIVDTASPLISSSYVLPDEALAEVSQLDPKQEFAHPHYTQGVQHANNNNHTAAIDAFTKCLALQPDYLPARYSLGVTLGNLEQYEAAVIQLKQVIEAEASYAEAHNSLGYVYFQLQQFGNAQKHFERAIAINPKLAAARRNLDALLSA